MRYQRFIIFTFLMIACLNSEPVISSEGYYRGNDTNIVYPKTNNTFPFQGYFTDSLGRPYFGTVLMGFEFCKDEDGNEIVYAENICRKVKVYNGFYATKISLPDNAFAKLASYDNIWVKVYVAKGAESQDDNKVWDKSYADAARFNSDAYLLHPFVQLTAAPYALGVRGLAYQSSQNNNKRILKVGRTYQQGVISDGKDQSLIISGNVGIGTRDATAAKLVIDGKSLESSGGDISINGTLSAPDGVVGAVWN